VRARLPRKGLVNYPEARAVVRRLEALAAAGTDEVAVIALSRAQAELIRLLVQDTPGLAGGRLRVEIDTPAAFRQREFPAVLVSLTRSHSRRAVAFGEEPAHLPLALTRARGRLVVFGDPGTLARRAQWEGVLDHLDEAAAAREGQVIGGLLRYLQGSGRHGRAFRVSEGGGT
jgi:superfamily I DNA and/or RNA helicase